MAGNKFVKKFNAKSGKKIDKSVKVVEKKLLKPGSESPREMARKLLR